MLRGMVLAGVVVLVVAPAALAAPLTDSDNRYLEDRYGLAPDGETMKGLSADEQARLHDLIEDPTLKEYPNTRDQNVADFLLSAHLRECSVWWLSHGGPECPPTSDASAEPGKEIADRRCNSCHLFGLPGAPSFRTLARAGKLDERGLADALDHGHAMSPISLQPEEIKELMAYIRSLK